MSGRPSGKKPRRGGSALTESALVSRANGVSRASRQTPTFGAIVAAGAAVAAVMLVLDLTWLGVIALDMYKRQLGPLMRPEPDVLAAVLFYTMYVVATTAFGSLGAKTVGDAMNRGGALGLVAYGTYELTNWAVISGWPVLLVPADIAWGIALTAISSIVGHVVLVRTTGRVGQ